MAKKSNSLKKRKLHRRMLIFGFASIGIIFATTFTIGKYWIEIYDKDQENEKLKIQLAELKDEEDELRLDAERLKDPEYIARYAREKYLYSKEGEFIIKIPEE